VSPRLIRDRLSTPFRAFELRTSDGREYAVREPYGAFVGLGFIEVVDDFGGVARLDPLHVVAVCELPLPTTLPAHQ
jgi:hypothetical protein